jgi:hypothetical protein
MRQRTEIISQVITNFVLSHRKAYHEVGNKDDFLHKWTIALGEGKGAVRIYLYEDRISVRAFPQASLFIGPDVNTFGRELEDRTGKDLCWARLEGCCTKLGLCR